MKYNVYFEAAALAYMIVINIYIRLQYNSATVNNRRFKQMSLTLLTAIALDLITAVTISFAQYVPVWVNTALNYLYLCNDVLLEYQFVLYCMLCSFRKKRPAVVRTSQFAVLIMLIILTVNLFTGWVYSFDKEAGYIHGPIYMVVHAVPIAAITLSITMLFMGFKSYNKNQRLCISLYTIIAISGPVVQIIFPNVLFVLFTVALGLLTLSFSMETPDFQALHKTMDELREARDKAEQADKAKSQFLASMSHELRTPINAVMGSTEAILRKTSDEEISKYAADSMNAGRRLLSMVNDVLSYTEMESDEFALINEEYAATSLLGDMTACGRYYAEKKNLEFKASIAENIPAKLSGDCTRLMQIMDNLLSNAAKYTEKGSIELFVGWESETETSGRFTFSVADTGIGISPENIEKLKTASAFRRFDIRRNENIEGIGLGLTIITRLLSYMDSELRAESEYGKGTRMSFSLMQKITDPTKIGAMEKRDELEAGKTDFIAPEAHILAVDDNSINLEIICRSLSQTRANIDTAKNGAEAVEKAREKVYDIIFLDHMMPIMDGIEALSMIRHEDLCPNTPIVVVTANAISGERELYLKAGFDDYISKPVTSRRLCEVLKKFLPPEMIKPLDEPEENSPPPQSSGILEKLSFLNTEMGMAYCCDDEDFYSQIITAFFEQNKTPLIEEAFASRDTENYRILLHALKGTSRTIGADALSESAKALETAARAEDWSFIEENNEAFLTEYNALSERLKKALLESSEFGVRSSELFDSK